MALDPNQDLNTLFNAGSYSTMFIGLTDGSSDVFPKIAVGGNLKTFTQMALTGTAISSTTPLLASPPTTTSASKFRIINYISSKPLKDVALGTVTSSSTQYKSIVDNYLYDSAGTLLSSASIINTLKTDKLILKDTDIYDISNPKTTLIGLYQLEEGGTITDTQKTTLTELETRNLKFFSAFLVEYWFYSCRYRWLLKNFFTYVNEFNEITFSNKPDYAFLKTAGDTAIMTAAEGKDTAKAVFLTEEAKLLAKLNMRMQDMITILNAINTDYSTMITTINQTLNNAGVLGSNKALTTTFTALQTSYTESDKYLTEKDFSKEVMEYNSEKNRHSNILLGLYAFLNIAALATVFHLASN